MIDFIAIDFETANHNTNSACAIGIAVVEELKVVDSFYSLLQPPNDFYDDINISIHGITPDMTADAPKIDDLWYLLGQWFSKHIPVVAHNAHFDVSVLLRSSTVDIPNFWYIDTMRMAKPFVSGKKSLDNCARELGVRLERHHNAQDDAVACAEIAIEVLKRSDCQTMWEYIASDSDAKACQAHEPAQKTSNPSAFFKPGNGYVHAKDIVPTVSDIDPSGPLYGKVLVFTGEMSLSRAEAIQMAVNAGAIVKDSVIKKTDYLVEGTQDEKYVGPEKISSKQKKARKFNDAGAHIKIITESDFLSFFASEGKP